MKSTWNKPSIWALITALGVGLLNACGDGEEEKGADSQNLSNDSTVSNFVTLWWHNRTCRNDYEKRKKDKTDMSSLIQKCESTTGCQLRGSAESKECLVQCSRITGINTCSKYADGCLWKQNKRCVLLSDEEQTKNSKSGESRGKKLGDLAERSDQLAGTAADFNKVAKVLSLKENIATPDDYKFVNDYCQKRKDGCDGACEMIKNECKTRCRWVDKKNICTQDKGCFWSWSLLSRNCKKIQ